VSDVDNPSLLSGKEEPVVPTEMPYIRLPLSEKRKAALNSFIRIALSHRAATMTRVPGIKYVTYWCFKLHSLLQEVSWSFSQERHAAIFININLF
jgi:hypothetical protein